jgi:hypothetical protein
MLLHPVDKQEYELRSCHFLSPHSGISHLMYNR